MSVERAAARHRDGLEARLQRARPSRGASPPRRSPWPVRLGTNLGYRFYAHHLHRFYNCDWIIGCADGRER